MREDGKTSLSSLTGGEKGKAEAECKYFQAGLKESQIQSVLVVLLSVRFTSW